MRPARVGIENSQVELAGHEKNVGVPERRPIPRQRMLLHHPGQSEHVTGGQTGADVFFLL